jgi:4'-phosphopantetheinyl transferase
VTGLRLFFCDTSSVTAPGLLSRYRDLLEPAETARLDRFRFEKDRHSFLVSHALLRTVLSEFTGTDAASLQFVAGEHGKPFLRSSRLQSSASLAFNLSHSGSYAVVAVCRGPGALGVDIEFHRGERRFAELSRRYFADSEIRALDAEPGHAMMGRFYDIWTLKEAYLKARGTGLQLPLEDFAFDFSADRVDFHARPGLDDCPQRWRFWCARFPGEFSVALALESEEPPEPGLESRVPLGESRPAEIARIVACSR